MSNAQFKHLFSPFQIKAVTLRNRIVSPGHGTFFPVAGVVNDRLIDYHVERAKGGVGLIVLEQSAIHPTAPSSILLWRDKVIPGLQNLTERVHEYGAKVFIQLGHLGRQAPLGYRLTWAASPMPYIFIDHVCPTPKEMEIEDIQEVVEGWGTAAARARTAGLDGVEIHPAFAGYLLSGFLSPYSNKRTDEYGGSLENRMRIVYQVIDSIRKNVGDDYVVGIKLNADDFVPGGLTLDDYAEIAQKLDATGKLDYITVTAGTYWMPNMVIPDMQHAPGMTLPLASAIKRVVKNAAIVAVGRIVDPIMAENVLAEGHADLVGICRGQIADPEFANKAKQGRLDDIRTCVGDNEGCLGRIFDARMGCIQNPAVGNERKLGIGTLMPAVKQKKVMIVGAGPGGLKAAEIAARRGHRVSIYEKEHEVGGQVNIAARAPFRKELEGATRHLAIQISKLGVNIHLGTAVTPDLVSRENPDAVVVATGSVPRRRSFTGIPPFDPQAEPKDFDEANVFTTWEVLEGKATTLGRRVLVVDDGEHWKGASTAEFLADQGREVHLITTLPFIGMGIQAFCWPPLVQRLFSKGIKMSPFTALKEVLDGEAVVYNIYTNQETRLAIDSVILAFRQKADDGLYFALKGKVKELHRIGDCLAPRGIGDAIREGEQVARKL